MAVAMEMPYSWAIPTAQKLGSSGDEHIGFIGASSEKVDSLMSEKMRPIKYPEWTGQRMRASAALAVSVLLLAGCSGASSLLNGKDTVPSAANVPVGNNLALPPDLQLAPPSGTSDAYQPNGQVASAAPAAPVAASLKLASAPTASSNLYGGTPVAAAPAGDVFDQYGISKINPDGTKKTPQQLHDELAAAILKKKQQANPKYGTFANIGAIFQDQ
jgi:hypothetical protein